MWEGCGLYPSQGIEELKLRCLIKIGDGGEFMVHDQLRDLGREIVRNENQEHPWHRSRLWDPKEALKVLRQNKVTVSLLLFR